MILWTIALLGENLTCGWQVDMFPIENYYLNYVELS